jgi:hypothetical protein
MWLPILCILILTTPSGIVSASASQKSIPVISVCELLAARQQYNGQLVAVVAVEASTDEGVWLRGGTCPVHVQTENYIWPDNVVLEYDPSKPSAIPEGVKIDEKEILSKLTTLTKAQDLNISKDWVLVVGRVQAENHDVVRNIDGKLRGLGYGHGNGSPVALLYCQRDIRPIPVTRLK